MHFKSDDEILKNISEQMFQKTGKKFDIHYSQGQGVLVVESGKKLSPENVVLTINEVQLQMVKMSGGNININF